MAQRYAILTVLILALTFSAARAAASLPQSESANFHERGPFTVETVDSLDLLDPEREKELTVKIYYPDGNGPFPVIVYSHALRGNKDRFGEVALHWASYGYVTVHPTHDDEGVAFDAARVMSPPAEKVLGRHRDVTFVLDALDQLEEGVPALRGKLDRDRVGVGGRSYGSFITMAIGGATAEVGAERNKNLADSRVKCVVPIATAGRGDYGLNDESWKTLTIPALFIGGTQDIRGGRAADWRLEPYKFSPPGDKYLIVIKGATHNAYGETGPGNDAPMYVKAASAAFWDACLRGSETAKAYLSSEDGFRRFARKGATLSMK